MKLRKLKEFCRLTNLSRKALLLYEEMGLLLPEKKDLNTGYRYYSDEQLLIATIIAFLKNCGIPLYKITDIIRGKLTLNQFLKTSHTRLNLISEQIKTTHALLAINLCEHDEQFLSTEMTQKIIAEMPVLSLETRARLQDVSLYHALLARYIYTYAIKISGAVFTFYYPDHTENKLHFKVCCPVPDYLEIIHQDIKWERLPAYKTAVIRSFGSYELLSSAYARLKKTIQEKKWESSGEYIETYILYGDERYTDSSTFITDVAAVLT